MAEAGTKGPKRSKPGERVAAPEEVARGVFARVSARDAAGVVELTHPDVVYEFVAIGEFHGRSEVRGFFQSVFAAFPDFDIPIDLVVVAGDIATVQWHATGTFTGQPFQGIAATGRAAYIRGVDVMEVVDGLIRRNTVYYDGAAFAREVGLLPAQGSRTVRALLSTFNAVTRLRGKVRGRRA
jgi:steroid delta-isomerase-like uncharacterized protein